LNTIAPSRFAIDARLVVEHFTAEALNEQLVPLGSGFVDVVRDAVGVDDDRAAIREHRGDRGFAGADATGEPDQAHGAPL
jgi:hypothetical protein